MKIAEVFNRLSKLLSVYDKLAAVRLKKEGSKMSVCGISKFKSFGLSVDVEMEDTDDFSVLLTPAALKQALNLNVLELRILKETLEVRGTFGTGEGSPEVSVLCEAVTGLLMKDVESLEEVVKNMLNIPKADTYICPVSEVLRPWQALVKCGDNRIYLTTDLTYSISASTVALYVPEKPYMTLERYKDLEPLQVESSYAEELQTMAGCGPILQLHAIDAGKVFLAVSEDNTVFVLSCAAVQKKNTYQRAKKYLESSKEFAFVRVAQSAIRDVLLAASDKQQVSIRTTESELICSSGVEGSIRATLGELEFDCIGKRESFVIALNALPFVADMELGYGTVVVTPFMSFKTEGIVLLVPVQEKMEIDL